MDLNKVIDKKRVIEISLFNETVFYSGVCIKATNSFWLIVNYNLDKGVFDGFSVFRNEDVDSYSVYVKKDLFMEKDNLEDYLNILPEVNDTETFYSCLHLFSSFKILAVSLEKKINSYYVGVFEKIENSELHIKVINTDFILDERKKIDIEKIVFFSFYTSYEIKAGKKVGKENL